jgi:S1-C subfamily serine protease
MTDHIRRMLAVLGGALAGLRRRIQPRVAAPIALLVVVIVAAAFALSSITGGGSKSTVINGVTSASLKLADQLLGAQLAAVPPRGVAIDTLDPGGPSETAGLEPGDVITAINGRPIEGSGDVAAAVRGLHGGEPVVVQVSRGSSIYSTLVAVATPGHP